MTQNSKQQKSDQVRDALTDIAANGDGESNWEVFHDPATGQMKFVRRGDPSSPPQPGSVPVTSIAATGFASAF